MKLKRDEAQFPIDPPEKIDLCLYCDRDDCPGACDKIGLTKLEKIRWERKMRKEKDKMARSKEAIQQAQKRYEESGVIIRKTLKVHRILDADIVKKINAQDNFNGYMKKLIRDDIKKQG